MAAAAPAYRIRPATPDDRAPWSELWKRYLEFYETTLPQSTFDVTWARLLDPSEPMHAALAETSDGKLVGLVHYIEHRSCWSPKNSIYLQDLYVDASARKRGIGRALIEYVYEDATKRGAGKVHWLTHSTNRDAQILYEKVAENAGFIQFRKNL